MRHWVLGTVVGMVLLQGCGSGKTPQTAQVTMWLVGSESQAKTINVLAEPFTQRTGVRVRCEAVSWGEAHSKYLTAVAGGVQPDIGTMGLTWGGEFGRLGALVNLRERFPKDIAAIERDTFAGLWDSIEQDGQVFGIPFDLSVQVLYYRTDLIPQPPATWEELTALLQRLNQDHRRMIIDWGNLGWIGYAPFLWQAGGDFYGLDSPEAVAALEFFRDLYLRYQVPRTSIPVEQGLRTGEFPLAISGNWKIVSLEQGTPELAGRWAIAPLPKGPTGRRTAFLGGRIVGLFAKSQNQEKAWDFVRYLFEPSVQVKLYEAALEAQDAYLPPNLATWDRLPMEPSRKAVLREQAKDAKGPPAVSGWTESTHLIETAIQRVMLHEADPGKELAEASAGINRANVREGQGGIRRER